MVAELFIPPIGLGEGAIFLVLVIVGIVIILILSAVIHFILPILAAVLVWFLTQNLIFAGAAFLGVAILQLLLRR